MEKWNSLNQGFKLKFAGHNESTQYMMEFKQEKENISSKWNLPMRISSNQSILLEICTRKNKYF